ATSASGCSSMGERSMNVPGDATRRPPIQCRASTATSATSASLIAIRARTRPVLIAAARRAGLAPPRRTPATRRSFGTELYELSGGRSRVRREHGAPVPADADLPVVAADDLPDLEGGELLGRRLEQLERGVAAPGRAALDAGAARGHQLAQRVRRAPLDRRHP